MLTDWIRKQNPSFFCIQKNTSQPQRQTPSQSKGLGKKIYQSNEAKKQAGVAILLSNKIDRAKISQKTQRRSFHISYRKNPSRGNFNTEHLYPKYKGTLICQRNTSKA